jgi:hypothetical protein
MCSAGRSESCVEGEEGAVSSSAKEAHEGTSAVCEAHIQEGVQVAIVT